MPLERAWPRKLDFSLSLTHHLIQQFQNNSRIDKISQIILNSTVTEKMTKWFIRVIVSFSMPWSFVAFISYYTQKWRQVTEKDPSGKQNGFWQLLMSVSQFRVLVQFRGWISSKICNLPFKSNPVSHPQYGQDHSFHKFEIQSTN